jgi:integrase
MALLRAVFNWAIIKGFVKRETKNTRGEYEGGFPFRINHVPVVKLVREEPRTRRWQPGGEDRLLAEANGVLRGLIVVGLETGCRLGELLSLQWEQVRAELFLPAGKTKAKQPRRVRMSTTLRTVLDARRHDPVGEPCRLRRSCLGTK